MASLQGLLAQVKQLQETQAMNESTSDEKENLPNGIMDQNTAKTERRKSTEGKASEKTDSKAKPAWAVKKKNAFWKAIAITSVNQKKDEKEGEIANLKQSLRKVVKEEVERVKLKEWKDKMAEWDSDYTPLHSIDESPRHSIDETNIPRHSVDEADSTEEEKMAGITRGIGQKVAELDTDEGRLRRRGSREKIEEYDLNYSSNPRIVSKLEAEPERLRRKGDQVGIEESDIGHSLGPRKVSELETLPEHLELKGNTEGITQGNIPNGNIRGIPQEVTELVTEPERLQRRGSREKIEEYDAKDSSIPRKISQLVTEPERFDRTGNQAKVEEYDYEYHSSRSSGNKIVQRESSTKDTRKTTNLENGEKGENEVDPVLKSNDATSEGIDGFKKNREGDKGDVKTTSMLDDETLNTVKVELSNSKKSFIIDKTGKTIEFLSNKKEENDIDEKDAPKSNDEENKTVEALTRINEVNDPDANTLMKLNKSKNKNEEKGGILKKAAEIINKKKEESDKSENKEMTLEIASDVMSKKKEKSDKNEEKESTLKIAADVKNDEKGENYKNEGKEGTLRIAADRVNKKKEENDKNAEEDGTLQNVAEVINRKKEQNDNVLKSLPKSNNKTPAIANLFQKKMGVSSSGDSTPEELSNGEKERNGGEIKATANSSEKAVEVVSVMKKMLEKKKRSLKGHFVEAADGDGEASWTSKRPGGRVPNNDLLEAKQKLRHRRKSIAEEDRKKLSKWNMLEKMVVSSNGESTSDEQCNGENGRNGNSNEKASEVVSVMKKILEKKKRSLPGHFVDAKDSDGELSWTAKRPGGRVPNNDFLEAKQKLRHRKKSLSGEDQKKLSKWNKVGHMLKATAKVSALAGELMETTEENGERKEGEEEEEEYQSRSNSPPKEVEKVMKKILGKKKRSLKGHFTEEEDNNGEISWTSKRPGGKVPNNDILEARQKLRHRKKSVSGEDQGKLSKWKVVNHVLKLDVPPEEPIPQGELASQESTLHHTEPEDAMEEEVIKPEPLSEATEEIIAETTMVGKPVVVQDEPSGTRSRQTEAQQYKTPRQKIVNECMSEEAVLEETYVEEPSPGEELSSDEEPVANDGSVMAEDNERIQSEDEYEEFYELEPEESSEEDEEEETKEPELQCEEEEDEELGAENEEDDGGGQLDMEVEQGLLTLSMISAEYRDIPDFVKFQWYHDGTLTDIDRDFISKGKTFHARKARRHRLRRWQEDMAQSGLLTILEAMRTNHEVIGRKSRRFMRNHGVVVPFENPDDLKSALTRL